MRILRLNRPEKRNALTPATVAELAAGIRACAADATTAGIVIAGEGPSFCTGVDLAEFAGGDRHSVRALIAGLADLCAAARRSSKPICCALHGHCLGAGLELAAACDLRVAAAGARLGMPEVLVGIPSVIDAVLLQQHIGLGRAKELILTGEPISAEQALDWGLVNRVVAAGDLIGTAIAMLESVARATPEAIRVQKALFEEWLNASFDNAVASSQEALAEAFDSGEPQELARRRMEERS